MDGPFPRAVFPDGKEDVLLSVVVPCKDEADVLQCTHRRLTDVLAGLGCDFEILYVDDGSTDDTAEILSGLQVADEHVRVIRFSRNFGHQMAITAGLQYAAGAAIVLIDADLQDPPELIADLLREWRRGYGVVYGVRAERTGETAFKVGSAKLFYRLINLLSDTEIPVDTGDFRLIDRKVADALLDMPERDRFLRGMVSWAGFRQIGVPYRRERRMAGQTKYPFTKMLRFATDGILSFSTVPLRLATWLGFAASAVALLGILLAVSFRIFTRNWVPGWTTIVIAVLFMGGVQLICLGIMGEYMGRIYGESKHRPLYLVEELAGFPSRPEVRPVAELDPGKR